MQCSLLAALFAEVSEVRQRIYHECIHNMKTLFQLLSPRMSKPSSVKIQFTDVTERMDVYKNYVNHGKGCKNRHVVSANSFRTALNIYCTYII